MDALRLDGSPLRGGIDEGVGGGSEAIDEDVLSESLPGTDGIIPPSLVFFATGRACGRGLS